jgi:hypothetical protein
VYTSELVVIVERLVSIVAQQFAFGNSRYLNRRKGFNMKANKYG